MKFVMICFSAIALLLVQSLRAADNYDKLVDEATELLEKNKAEEALDRARSAIEADNTKPDAFLIAALAIRREGDSGRALEALNEAIKRAPENRRAKFEQMRAEFSKPIIPVGLPLTGEVEDRHGALMKLISDADNATGDNARRKKLLREFMAKSAEFLELSDSDAKVWLLRAACSVELDYPGSGWLAGRKLKGLGLDNSSDENTRKVLAALERKGWLGDKPLWRDWSKWTMTAAKGAAEDGDEEALGAMGDWYEKGSSGLTKDEAEAAKWRRRAAEQGGANAQYNVGIMYNNGKGVTADTREAMKWFRRAAAQEIPNALYMVGYMYANGRGVPKDNAEAAAWYRKAAEKGHSNAQNNLGVLYEYGNGVQKDTAEALKWYRKAVEADPENELAKNNLKRLDDKSGQ